MSYRNHKAFTMVELIVVIIIIGILVAVAIPKLAANRDNANAAICTQDVQHLLTEISQLYVLKGYTDFSILPIEKITNTKVGVVEKNGISSLQGTLVSSGIKYMCSSEDIVEIKGILSGSEYNLSITDLSPTTPSALAASELIQKLHGINMPGGSRTFKLY